MSDRLKAFEKPLPPDWQPQVGERVYLSRIQKTSFGVVRARLLDDLFIIEYHFGGRRNKQFIIKDLRPYEPRSFEGTK